MGLFKLALLTGAGIWAYDKYANKNQDQHCPNCNHDLNPHQERRGRGNWCGRQRGNENEAGRPWSQVERPEPEQKSWNPPPQVEERNQALEYPREKKFEYDGEKKRSSFEHVTQ